MWSELTLLHLAVLSHSYDATAATGFVFFQMSLRDTHWKINGWNRLVQMIFRILILRFLGSMLIFRGVQKKTSTGLFGLYKLLWGILDLIINQPVILERKWCCGEDLNKACFFHEGSCEFKCLIPFRVVKREEEQF